MFHFMRLGLTTEGAETPVRAARKEACERIRFAQLGRNSPTLDGRQMICGRGVDEWHEVRLPPSSFRAPRSGFPRFQWLTDLSTAPPYQVRPFARPGHRQLGPPGIKTLHSLFTPLEKRRSSRLNDQTLSGGAFPAATASCPPHADCGRIVMFSGEAVNNPPPSALCGLVFDFG